MDKLSFECNIEPVCNCIKAHQNSPAQTVVTTSLEHFEHLACFGISCLKAFTA